MTVLECSSAGDKRFSALYATVALWNRTHTIEEWYQFSKVFGTRRPATWKEAKQVSRFMKPTECVIHFTPLDIKFLTPWYKLLWLIYLDRNAFLVDYASKFDEFHDKFKGKSKNCQADVIRQYIHEGRFSVYQDCQELIGILNIKEWV